MKLSKQKYFGLFVLTLAICFSIGFAIGAFPRYWKTFRGKDTSSLLVLFSDEKMIPSQTLLAFEKTTGVHVEAKAVSSFALFQTEAKKVDLMFAPLAWFGSLREVTEPLRDFKTVSTYLFSDFLSLQLSPQSFFPVFWSIDHAPIKDSGDEMSFWGFFTAQLDESSQSRAHSFMLYLLENPQHIRAWAAQVQKSTTLDMEEVQDEFQPQHIRQYQLLHTKILNKLAEPTETP